MVCDSHCTSVPTFQKAALFRESGSNGWQSTFTSLLRPPGVKKNGYTDSLYGTVLQEKVIISQLVKQLPTVKAPGIPLPCSHEPATCPYLSHINSNFQPRVHFPLLKSFQRIPPSPRFCRTFCNLLVYYCEKFYPSLNPQARLPPLDSCPELLIKYIHSFSAYLEVG